MATLTFVGQGNIASINPQANMARQRGYAGLEQVLVRVSNERSVVDVDDVLLRAAAAGDADLVAHALRADGPRTRP